MECIKESAGAHRAADCSVENLGKQSISRLRKREQCVDRAKRDTLFISSQQSGTAALDNN